jgi:hypothetical protein
MDAMKNYEMHCLEATRLANAKKDASIADKAERIFSR